MAKSSNQKLKLLRLWQILAERTDEDHPITTPELIQLLAQDDITAERKSIYADMEALRWAGLDVQSRKGKQPGWFVGQRPFELAELKLLVDAVQASRFFTRRKSAQLIGKLERLASTPQARQLQRQVYVDKRVKTMNESIYYNVDKLHSALASGKTISFRYFEYNVRKEKVFRRDGKRYMVRPYGLIWDNENYYLVGFDLSMEQVRHYRVDKMAELALISFKPEEAPDADGFDMATYADRHFGMFSGREAHIRLRCQNRMVGVILDRFGQDVILIPDGEEHFTVTVDAVVSPQFYGWLFSLSDGVELTGPAWVASAYLEQLREALERNVAHIPREKADQEDQIWQVLE